MEHHLTTYITHDTLISALGFGTQENLEAIRSYHSGITLQTDKRIADTPLLAAALSYGCALSRKIDCNNKRKP